MCAADNVTFTLENLQALTDAIAQGVKKVKYSDKEVEYADLNDLLKLRELMRTELCPETTTSTAGVIGRRRRVAVYHSGHYPIS